MGLVNAMQSNGGPQAKEVHVRRIPESPLIGLIEGRDLESVSQCDYWYFDYTYAEILVSVDHKNHRYIKKINLGRNYLFFWGFIVSFELFFF